MSRYREDLDRKIFSKTWVGKNWQIEVTVYSYQGGRPKLQLTRQKATRSQHRPYAKLGRLSRDELDGIMPFLQEALHHMGGGKSSRKKEQGNSRKEVDDHEEFDSED